MKRDRHYVIQSKKGVPVHYAKTLKEAITVRDSRWVGYIISRLSRPTL